jgi:uncharacterized membrane protein
MFLILLNYVVRSLVILIGLGMLLLPSEAFGKRAEFMSGLRLFGLVAILFGIYRLVTFHFNRKKYEEDED